MFTNISSKHLNSTILNPKGVRMEDAWTRKSVVASEQSVEVDDIRKLKKALWSKIDSHMKSKNHQNCVHVRDIQQQNIFHKAVAIQ